MVDFSNRAEWEQYILDHGIEIGTPQPPLEVCRSGRTPAEVHKTIRSWARVHSPSFFDRLQSSYPQLAQSKDSS